MAKARRPATTAAAAPACSAAAAAVASESTSCDALEQAGYQVEEIDPPAFAAVAGALTAITRHEAPHYNSEDYEKYGDERLRRTYRLVTHNSPPPDLNEYMEALAERSSWIRVWSLFLEDWPIVLCPTAFDPPMPQDVTGVPPEAYTRMFQAMMPSYVVPLLGLSGLAVPTGLDDDLPTGVQLIAGRFREDLVLDAGEAIEAALPPVTPIDPR